MTIIKFMWEAPQNILASLFILICRMVGLVSYSGNIVEEGRREARYFVMRFGGNAAFALGQFIVLYSGYDNETEKPIALRHEYGHCMQSARLGWLYLFVIALPSLIVSGVASPKQISKFYTEKWANKLSRNVDLVFEDD